MTRLFITLLTSLSLLLGQGIVPAFSALPSDMGGTSESRVWLLNNENDPLLIENTNLLNNENPEDLDYLRITEMVPEAQALIGQYGGKNIGTISYDYVNKDNFGVRYVNPDDPSDISKTPKPGFVKRVKDHMGTDIASPKGSEIHSPVSGKVSDVGYSVKEIITKSGEKKQVGRGYYIEIESENENSLGGMVIPP